MQHSKHWFGIDGIDCTGKTSILHALQSDVDFRSHTPAIIFEEFTTSAAGIALQEIISEHRFLSLSIPPHTRWADTLLLLSDWSYKIESFANSRFNLAFSDRSHLSIIGYQIDRLTKSYPSSDLDLAANSLSLMILAIRSSFPNIQFIDILLKVDGSELQRRVIARGEKPLSEEQKTLLLRAQSLQEQSEPDYVIDTSQRQLGEVLSEIRSIIRSTVLC